MNVPSVGTPYAFPSRPPESFDCWTFVEHIRELAGRATVLKLGHEDGTPENMEAEVEAESLVTDWRKVEPEEVEDFDVILMGTKHVGVYFSGLVGHVIPDSGVAYHSWTVVRRSFSRVQVYRP